MDIKDVYNRIMYKKLLEEKERILNLLENTSKEASDSMDMFYTELSGYDNHPADIATEVYMMEQERGYKNKLKDTLREIEESLEDMEKGTYGRCDNCNRAIDIERLELIPYAKSCVECSKELAPAEDLRRLSNEKVDANFYGTKREDHAYFDREDTLQQIVQYNIVENDPSSSTGDNMGIMDEEDVVEPVEYISQEYYEDTLK